MSKYLALSFIGKDQPGIVAAVSKALFDAGCNLEESTMTKLRNEFAMILIVKLGTSCSINSFKKIVETTAKKNALSVSVRDISNEPISTKSQKGKKYIITVYGADKPGIVYAISSYLAKNKFNITDVQTTLSAKAYVMFIEILLPAPKEKQLLNDISKVAKILGVNISAHQSEEPEL